MPAKDTYKSTEPDVMRFKNRVAADLKELGITASFQFPEWLTGMDASEFKTKTTGNIRSGDRQTLWKARGQVLCKLSCGQLAVSLKLVGPNDSQMTFEVSHGDKKESFDHVDANILEPMLLSLIDQMKKSVKMVTAARKAFVRV